MLVWPAKNNMAAPASIAARVKYFVKQVKHSDAMGDIFAVRDVDEGTKRFIYTYARSRRMKVGRAIKEIAYLAQEHLKETAGKKKKKYKTLAETFDRIKFRGDADLSQKIDEIVYGV